MRASWRRREFTFMAFAFAIIGGVQLVGGAYTTGVFTLVLAVVVALRAVGVIPSSGLLRRRDGLSVCPRCGERKLAPDLDHSGVRHCWGCGADISASSATDGS
jgi:hypothetical protein